MNPKWLVHPSMHRASLRKKIRETLKENNYNGICIVTQRHGIQVLQLRASKDMVDGAINTLKANAVIADDAKITRIQRQNSCIAIIRFSDIKRNSIVIEPEPGKPHPLPDPSGKKPRKGKRK